MCDMSKHVARILHVRLCGQRVRAEYFPFFLQNNNHPKVQFYFLQFTTF